MNDHPEKRKPRHAGLFVIGMSLIALGISTNMAFMGAGVVFMIIVAAGMKKERDKEK